MFVLYLLRLN